MKRYTSIDIKSVENGYVLGYYEDGAHKDRVFYTWLELCDWLREQIKDAQ